MSDAQNVTPDVNQEQAPVVELNGNQKIDQIHALLAPFMDAVSGVLQRGEASTKDVTSRLDKFEDRLDELFAHLRKSNPAPEPAPAPAEVTATGNLSDVPGHGEQPAAPAEVQPTPVAPVDQPANPAAVPAEDRPAVQSDVTTVDAAHTDAVNVEV